MNYEELLSARDSEKNNFNQLMLGKISKREVDGKYINVVDIKKELTDNILFSEYLQNASMYNASLVLDGTTYTFIPEPSAFGLLAGLGALALAGTRRRRRK